MKNERATDKTFYLVQALRGVAALMVLLYHCTKVLHDQVDQHFPTWDAGASGVDIFFVISGFVMTLSSTPLRTKARPAVIFLTRRLERIVPLYWIVTSAQLLLIWLAPALSAEPWPAASYILSSLLFLPTSASPVVSVGWTLNFEMCFYVLFALALSVRLPLVRSLAPILIGLSILSHYLPPGSLVRSVSNPIMIEFLFGMILATWVMKNRVPDLKISWALLLLGFLFLLRPGHNWQHWRPIDWGLPALAVMAGAVGLESRLGAMVPSWILATGDASYSIYLVHLPLFAVLASLLVRYGLHSSLEYAIFVPACFTLGLVAGFVCYQFVELPFLNYFRVRRHSALQKAQSL